MDPTHPNPVFPTSSQIAPHLHLYLLLGSGISEEYRPALIQCVQAIYIATSNLPVSGAIVSLFEGTPVQMRLTEYVVNGLEVLVSMSCTATEAA